MLSKQGQNFLELWLMNGGVLVMKMPMWVSKEFNRPIWLVRKFGDYFVYGHDNEI